MPPLCFESGEALSTYYRASRARRYTSGMMVSPLPLSIKDVTDVIDAHGLYMDRELLDLCVFAIDDVFMQKARDDAQKDK